MKILCENCQAKYSISDEKIRGKVFRIRCKKCSEPIIVRGDKLGVENDNEPFSADDEGRVSIFDQDDPSAVWFALIDDEQEGPYTAEQIQGLLSDGTMDEATYVWKEGFEDWLPLNEVPELQPPKVHRKVSAPPFARPSGGPPKKPSNKAKRSPFDASEGTFTDAPNLFESNSPGLFDNASKAVSSGSPFHSGGGLFDTGSPDKSNGMFSEAAASAASKGLFGVSSPASSPTPAPARGNSKGLFSAVDKKPQGAEVPAAQPGLTGQRNESSVLFSLSNLQQLAANPAPRQQQAAGFTPGPGTEASGLIDIRTLASALKDETETSVEDLLSLSPGGFSPAMSAPILSARSGLTKPLLYGLIGGVVLLLATLVILIVVLTSSDNEPDPQLARLVAELEELRKQQPVEGTAGLDTRKELEKREQELKARIAQRKAENEKEKEKRLEVSGSSRNDNDGAKSKGSDGSGSKSSQTKTSRAPRRDKAASTGSASTPKATNSKSSSKGATNELDDLLGGSSKKAPQKKPEKTAQPSGGAKTSLSRSDVKTGMASVASRVKQCGQGQQGTITLKVVISPSGRVISAAPSGSFSGTSVGACAARAVRSARFPKFSGSNLTVRYPFRL